MTTAVLAPDLVSLLDPLVADVQQAMGPTLRGVAIYGGLAKGRYTPGISDINLLIVAARADYATLTALARVLMPARRRHRVAPLVLTPEDLAEFGRLFPVKLADMQAAHRVLIGDVGLGDVTIDPAAFSLRLRQELRNLELRFRQTIVERGAEPLVIWRRLTATLPRLAIVLEAILRQRAIAVPKERGEILRTAARSLGLPAEAVEAFAAIHREDPSPAGPRIDALATAYLTLLRQLGDRVESAQS